MAVIPFQRQIDEDDPLTIVVDVNGPGVSVDRDGLVKTENEDGSVTFGPKEEEDKADDDSFDANLAEKLEVSELYRIASELLRAIETDEQSREEWLQTRAKLLDLLGLKIEEARADAGASTAPLEGMSTVRHPLLAEAVIRFQSNASGELLPTGGPVKVRDDTPPMPRENAGTPPQAGSPAAGATPVGDRSDLAMALEKDFNHYLTVTDKGYYPDTDRMLFWVGFGGCSFKKVYHDPIKRMPISRMVDPADLIVSNAANDLDDAGRITHRILMRPSILRRMQLANVYRDIDLIHRQPNFEPNAVEQKQAQIVGFQATPRRPEDHPFTIYECYTELDIKGFEHKEDGKATGLALPYKVVIEKESQQVLEIRRNWKEEDKNYMAKKVFVKYPFVPATGFYDIGLGQIIGNATRALTGAWRILLDAGMFSCFPGFLYAKTAGRQVTNQFRVPPAGGLGIEVPSTRNIQEMVMPLPYKEPSASLIEMLKIVEQTGMRLGGTAETKVAEGKQDAPVGTTLAMIEQATKILSAVHIRLHRAQAEEFQLLKTCFQENPESFWRHNPRPAALWEIEQFLQAIQDHDIVPAADPNTPSQMHRMMKVIAIKQLQAMNTALYDGVAVDTLVLHMIGVSDPERLFAPPQATPPPAIPPDPNKMAELQQREREHQREMAIKIQESQMEVQSQKDEHTGRMAELALQGQDRAQDRQSRERVEMLKMQAQAAKDQAQMQLSQQQAHVKMQTDAAMQHQKMQHQQQLQEHQMSMQEQQHQQGMQMEQHKGAMQAHQQQQSHEMSMEQAKQKQAMTPPTQGAGGGGGKQIPPGPIPRNDAEGKI